MYAKYTVSDSTDFATCLDEADLGILIVMVEVKRFCIVDVALARFRIFDKVFIFRDNRSARRKINQTDQLAWNAISKDSMQSINNTEG